MKVIKVVGAVITNELGQILCAKRSNTMSMPGKWEFPGGKVEEFEDEVIALRREIKEELLCEIEVNKKLTETIHSYSNFTIQLVTYYAKIVSGKPKNIEHAELKWVESSELKSLDWAEADIPAVQMIAK